MVFLMVLLSLENGLLYGFDILFGIAGLALGVFYGATNARWILGEIDEKGEFKNTREVIIYIVFVILIIGPLIFDIMPLAGRWVIERFSSFAYLLVLSAYATRVLVFWSWEKERGKHIATAGLWGMKVSPAKQ
jgi:hypothetical protein